MGEFDFDELDKAVNTLMSEHNKNVPAQDAPSQPANSTPAAQSTQDTANQTTDSTPTVQQTDRQQPTPTSMASRRSIVPNRRGQFMDVMHPSKPATVKNEPRKMPLRKAVNLQPATMSSPAEPVDPVMPSPGVDISPPANDPTQSAEQKQSDWPDPLDMMEKHEETIMTSLQDEPSEAEVQPGTSPEAPILDTEPSTSSATDPMSSPFLPDAKVEKRPLGSVNEESPVDTPPQPELETADESDSSVEPASTQVAASTDLPAEFHSEIMNIESQQGPTEPSPSQPVQTVEADSPAPQANELPVDDAEKDQLPEAAPESEAAPKDVLVSSLPPRQPEGSAQTDDDDIPDSSIFDSEASQSLKHPVKHSTGWFAVVIIGAMLLIGALGGVIFYYMSNGY